MLCGVKEEEIVSDYMRTKECNKERFKLISLRYPEIDMNIVIPRESYIRDFMKTFKDEYGSADEYMKSIGLEEDTIERLRNKLLR